VSFFYTLAEFLNCYLYICGRKTRFFRKNYKVMVDEKIILQVLAEQQEEIKGYKPQKWVTRKEESLLEFDTKMAQVVIGVRRSGKSTICHKVLSFPNFG